MLIARIVVGLVLACAAASVHPLFVPETADMTLVPSPSGVADACEKVWPVPTMAKSLPDSVTALRLPDVLSHFHRSTGARSEMMSSYAIVRVP